MLSRVREEVGQGLMEYGIILILIAAALILLLTVFGEQIAYIYERVVNAMPF